MICDPCIKAATVNAKVVAAADEHGSKNVILVDHPENCGCPCQHRAPGSWKGKKNSA